MFTALKSCLHKENKSADSMTEYFSDGFKCPKACYDAREIACIEGRCEIEGCVYKPKWTEEDFAKRMSTSNSFFP